MQIVAWLALAPGCSGGQVYVVEGTVVEVHPPDEIVVDHEAISGLMGAMVMPFDVADPSMLDGIDPGTQIVARYRVDADGSRLVAIRVTGHVPPPPVATGPVPLRVGERLAPDVPLTAHDGTTVVLGPSQMDRIALTFVYTRCPVPEYCPATVQKLASIAAALQATPGGDGRPRLVAVTLDPSFDTVPVLADFAKSVGAGGDWLFARAVDDAALSDLAMRAGLPVLRSGEPGGPANPAEIAHGRRVLVFDRGGLLVERYDDLQFPIDRVVEQLRTGAPAGDPSVSGTVSAPSP